MVCSLRLDKEAPVAASRLISPIALLLALALALLACDGDPGPTGPDGVDPGELDSVAEDADATEDAEEADLGPEPLTSWPDHVEIFPFLGDQSFPGDIATGQAVDMGWADEPGVYCWLPNITKHFTGHQVYFAMDKLLQKTSQLTITVTPDDPNMDLNVYAYGLSDGVFYFPPEVPAVSACESGRVGGPGEPETVYLQNLQAPLQWLIAVSGPEGVSQGAFTLAIDRTDAIPSLP